MDAFNFPVRVYMEDVDAGGIVFYANYLKYFERARTEFVRTLGVQLRDSLRDNINYVVYNIDIKYIKSARLDDELMITVRVPEFSKTSMTFMQEALNTEEDLNPGLSANCLHAS